MANEYALNFKEALKAHRMSIGASARARTRNKKPSKLQWLYPTAIENRMFLDIRKYIRKPLTDLVYNTMYTDLELWINEKQNNDSILNEDSEIRNDSWVDDVNNLTRNLRILANQFLGNETSSPENSEAWVVLIGLATSVLIFNRKQKNKILKQYLGFEYNTNEFWFDEVAKTWASTNYNFFRDLSNEYIRRINNTVLDGVKNDLVYSEIMKNLKKIDKEIFTTKRAKLIARDQIGKLNGEITKIRMQEIGLDLYQWLTAMDERVRGNPSGLYPNAKFKHFYMNYKICSWSDDSVFVNEDEIVPGKPINWKQRFSYMPIAKPGEQIQCRCTAVPYLNELLLEVDLEIGDKVA